MSAAFIISMIYRLLLILTLIAAQWPALRANDFLRALPSVSAIVTGYADSDSVTARMRQAPLTPVEGLWQMLDGGALFALERHTDPALPASTQPGTYRLVMVKAPSRLIRPGTVIGHAVATTQADVLEARIYTDFALEHHLGLPRSFTLHLASDGAALTFKPRKSRFTINAFRLLPYMYRNVVRLRDNRPDNLDGAIRVYPPVITPRFGPRYL